MSSKSSWVLHVIGFTLRLFKNVLRSCWRLISLIFRRWKSQRQKRYETIAKLIDGKKSPLDLYHWHKLVEDLDESPQRFYNAFEQAIHRRDLPGMKLSRIERFEGGILSPKREIIKISRRDHIFEMYAAPFGNGFYVSWRLRMEPAILWRVLLTLPFFGST